MEIPEDKRQAIQEAVYGGAPRKLEAIKLVREATGCGLKEAKECVEKISSELYAKEPEKFVTAPTGKGGCAGVLMLVVVMLSAVLAMVMYLV